MKYIVPLVLLCFGFVNQESDESRYLEMQEIVKNSVMRDGYTKTANYQIVDGIEQEKVVTEYWSKGDRMKIKSRGVSIFMDAKLMITISESNRLIIVQNVVKKQPRHQVAGTLFPPYDSVKTNIENIAYRETDKHSHIAMQYTKEYSKRFGISATDVVYTKASKKLVKVLNTRLYPSGLVDVMEYISFSKNISSEELPHEIISTIYADGQLRAAYKNYTISDLRNQEP